ncbi:hypothetical protein [Pseudooceanicola marinus]|uniref:hypothetical protein n=1 Tax=Pseudooceanicola marinus TaxID=396013 RepID=UPI001CD30EF9|nr:hypothetical protein [Pseudooceanicola marinus]MCA1334202.1 hypothetical protein [Pseudooceanicola marinus]
MSNAARKLQQLNALRARAQRHADSSDSPAMRRVCLAIMVETNTMLRPLWRSAHAHASPMVADGFTILQIAAPLGPRDRPPAHDTGNPRNAHADARHQPIEPTET